MTVYSFRAPSDHARSFVGQECTYESNRRGYQGPATIVDVRRPGGTITTRDGTYPAVEYKLKPLDGSRAFWTVAMPDREPQP